MNNRNPARTPSAYDHQPSPAGATLKFKLQIISFPGIPSSLPDPFPKTVRFGTKMGWGSKLDASASTTYKSENGTIVPFSAHENAILRHSRHSCPFVAPLGRSERVRTVTNTIEH